ncbi:MAG: hypothetical protein RL095_1241 [Verrucomicrobiota bacterium]|jgi:hypothetical protein
MSRLMLFVAISTCLLLWAAPADRFASCDLVIESDSPFSAWQAEIRYPAGVILTLIENGEGAFVEAPDYDRRGLERGRIILASYTLENQPEKRLRVARLHFLAPSDANQEDWTVRLTALGDSQARRISGRIHLKTRHLP